MNEQKTFELDGVKYIFEDTESIRTFKKVFPNGTEEIMEIPYEVWWHFIDNYR